jgi:hypothetical protein
MVVVVVLILPGLIPAIIVGTMEAWGTAAGTGILALWQVIVAMGCFWMSKDIIHKCDMPTAKLWK